MPSNFENMCSTGGDQTFRFVKGGWRFTHVDPWIDVHIAIGDLKPFYSCILLSPHFRPSIA